MERKYRQFVSSFVTSTRNGFVFYPECTRSQQDLTLIEVNKRTCMLVDAVSSQVLRCIYLSPLQINL